jgi:uncharacterized protein (DUF58 family)
MRYAPAAHVVLFGSILIGVIGWVFSGEILYARLAYLGIFLLAGSAFFTWYALRGITVKRVSRLARLSVGDIFEERYEISNNSWMPVIWLAVRNESSLSAESGSRLVINLKPRQKRFYTVRTLITNRGVFELGPTVISVGDVFGFFVDRKVIQSEKALVVLPLLYGIEKFGLPVGLVPGGKDTRQTTPDVTPHASGLREYVPSDPLKRIHWPSTAKRNRFMVKEFEQDSQSDVWLFLDAQRDARVIKPGGEKLQVEDGLILAKRVKARLPDDTFEYAVSACASLARYFLQIRRSVGLACSTIKPMVIQPDRGDRQQGKLMEALALIQADGYLPIWSLAAMQSKLIPPGSSVIIITSTIRSELLVCVGALQSRNLRPVVVLIDAKSFAGPGGTYVLTRGLLKYGVPVCQVKQGDDLGAVLSIPGTFLYQRSPGTVRSYTSAGL